MSGLLEVLRLNCSHITELRINHVPAVAADSLVALLRAIPDLQVLTLQSCQSLRDEHLRKIAACTKKLRHLELSHCEFIRGDGLVPLVRSNSQLHYLGLERCYELTTGNLLELAEHTDHLTQLNLRHLNQCTEDIVQQFLDANQSLDKDHCYV